MTRRSVARIASAGVLLAVSLVCTSCIYVHSDGSARYEKEMELSAPLAAGSSFLAETDDGSITLR